MLPPSILCLKCYLTAMTLLLYYLLLLFLLYYLLFDSCDIFIGTFLLQPLLNCTKCGQAATTFKNKKKTLGQVRKLDITFGRPHIRFGGEKRIILLFLRERKTGSLFFFAKRNPSCLNFSEKK